MLWNWILSGLTLCYAGIVISLLSGLARLKVGKNKIQRPVSVIVVARNEEVNINNCLKAIASQTYPEKLTQLVLVNDRSEDRTGEIITEFSSTHSNSTVIQIEKCPAGISPKKQALAQGISIATGQILLFTDADCQPGPDWISEMITYFEDDVGLVAGFSPLISEGKSPWKKIIELDSLASAVVAAGSIGLGKATTGTGRNLAYTREVFYQVDGFKDIQHSLSGDDDLFLHLVKNKSHQRIRYAISPGAMVPGTPVLNLREFFQQRKRHFSAGKYYPRSVQTVYLVMHSANLALFLFLVRAFFQPSLFPLALTLFSIKLTLDFSTLVLGARNLSYRPPLAYFLLWEIYFVFYNTIIGPLGIVGKVRWKG